MALDVVKLEERIDRVAAGNTEISMGLGGVKFATLLELMEFAKLMAVSGAAVPSHLRGNPGTCLAIATKALRFGFDPFSLAEHSYTMVKSTKVDGQWQDVETIAYDSFVIHAIIEAHGNVTGKLRPIYEGEGDERKCTCIGVVNGESLTVTSDTLGKIKARIGRNDKGKLKGSPLWDTKPDQQLWYDTRRDWCRAHQPHILLGWYDREELLEHGAARARDVTPEKPGVAARLTGSKGRGFNAHHVEHETAQSSAPADAGAAAGTAFAAPLNSSETLAPPPAASETNPAPLGTGQVPDGAGATQSPAAASGTAPPVGEDRQASESGDPALHGSGGLPEDWPRLYAQKLSEAKAPRYLTGIASKFWNALGGWEKHKTLPHASTATAIYDAFAEHFGTAGEEARNVILRELSAL